MQQIPRFRYVEQIHAFLNGLKTKQEDLTNLLAQSIKPINVDQGTKQKIQANAKKIYSKDCPLVNKQIVANVYVSFDKQKEYAILKDLWATVQQIEILMVQASVDFTNHNLNKVKIEAQAISAATKKVMRDHLTSLNAEALTVCPPEFRAMTNKVISKLKGKVGFDDQREFTYLGANSITRYHMLSNVNGCPQMYLAFKWQLGAGLELFLDHEFELPDDLKNGVQVKSSLINASANIVKSEFPN